MAPQPYYEADTPTTFLDQLCSGVCHPARRRGWQKFGGNRHRRVGETDLHNPDVEDHVRQLGQRNLNMCDAEQTLHTTPICFAQAIKKRITRPQDA